jgi:hypothetical protein
VVATNCRIVEIAYLVEKIRLQNSCESISWTRSREITVPYLEFRLQGRVRDRRLIFLLAALGLVLLLFLIVTVIPF